MLNTTKSLFIWIMKDHGLLFIFKSRDRKSGTVCIQDKVIKPLPWHPATSGLYNTIINKWKERPHFLQSSILTQSQQNYWQSIRGCENVLWKYYYRSNGKGPLCLTTLRWQEISAPCLLYFTMIYMSKCAASWFSFCSPEKAVNSTEGKAQC